MILKFWNNHWRSILWAAFILVLCGIPGNELNKVKIINIPHLDKFVHFFLYFVFTLLLISENNPQKYNSTVTVKAFLMAAAFALSYGALIEILQKVLFVGRGADIWDMVANTSGFLLASLAYRPINRITEGYL